MSKTVDGFYNFLSGLVMHKGYWYDAPNVNYYDIDECQCGECGEQSLQAHAVRKNKTRRTFVVCMHCGDWFEDETNHDNR